MTKSDKAILAALQNAPRVYDRTPIIERRKARLRKANRREAMAQLAETIFCVSAFGFVASVWAFVGLAIVGAQ